MLAAGIVFPVLAEFDANTRSLTTAYTMLGGVQAVTWTDVKQKGRYGKNQTIGFENPMLKVESVLQSSRWRGRVLNFRNPKRTVKHGRRHIAKKIK